MTWRRSGLIGEILVKKGLITSGQLEDALRVQKTTQKRIGEILVSRGLITERDLLAALSERFNLPLLSIKDKEIDWDLAGMFSKTLLWEHRCFPIEKTEDTIIFAVSDPLDAWIVSRAEQEAKTYRVERVLVCRQEIDEVLEKYRQRRKNKIDKLLNRYC